MDNLIKNKKKKRRFNHLHFVGIGGVGMSGIAEVLLKQGYLISGSDSATSTNTERLQRLGATIFIGHAAQNVEGADVVVVSSAVSDTNAEVQCAKSKRIPIVPRALMLAELMRFHYGIAIAGTHGKTTTTSLLADLLTRADLDPTFVIGGKLNVLGSNAYLGKSEYFIAEADESDASFLHLQPMACIVTNIDRDHLPTYGNDFNRLCQIFVEFIHNLPFDGYAVMCLDDANIQALLPSISRRVITYGFSPDSDYCISEFKQSGLRTQFIVTAPNKLTYEIQLNLPGRHNALNATAAMIVALNEGVDIKTIQLSLNEFAGINRRFQCLGDLKLGDTVITVVDDYGHHPQEVQATLAAARLAWPYRRIVMAYQPHRYTRTRDTFEETVHVVSQVDSLLLLEVYGAGETPIEGADSRHLCRAIRQRGQVEPIYVASVAELLEVLPTALAEQDVLILQGAGNIGSLAQQLVALSQRAENEDLT